MHLGFFVEVDQPSRAFRNIAERPSQMTGSRGN
jgi:hypothetical protein